MEFTSSRYAYNEHERFTPDELGLGWLLKGIDDPSRPFIGRDSIIRERMEGTSRWRTVGITVAWQDYYELYDSRGVIPVPDEIPVGWETMIYNDKDKRIGYATSFMYSPSCSATSASRGSSRSTPSPAPRSSSSRRSTMSYINVRATVTTLPFYNPERKTA